MVNKALAVQSVRLPAGRLRFGGERSRVVGEGFGGAHVTDAGGQPDRIGKQVLDLLELFGVVGDSGRELSQGFR